MKTGLAIAVFLIVFHVNAATGGKGRGFSAAPAPAGKTITTGHGSSGRMIKDPRSAPELDPTRKVSERDCTKPLDLDGGNLRCK